MVAITSWSQVFFYLVNGDLNFKSPNDHQLYILKTKMFSRDQADIYSGTILVHILSAQPVSHSFCYRLMMYNHFLPKKNNSLLLYTVVDSVLGKRKNSTLYGNFYIRPHILYNV